MQFEFWGMQWFPKEKGELSPKDRSPGVHSQQNLEYTSSLVTPAPHTIYPTKAWEAEPGAFAKVFGICSPSASRLHSDHVEQSHVRGVYLVPNIISVVHWMNLPPQVQKLWGELGPVWTVA